MRPFIPALNGATVRINVAATSAAVALAAGSEATQVRVMNDGSATVWINFGVSGVTASATAGIPVPAGAVEVLTVPPCGGALYAAAIAAGATGYVYFTPGSGI